MGSGVGITLYGTHRVAGARYRFAMPEVGIGLFPDVGTAHALAHMPGEIGMYLALTGRSIGSADAYASRSAYALHTGSSTIEEIKSALSDTWPVDPLLDVRHVDPGPGELEPFAETISGCFGASTVEQILQRLSAVDGSPRAWAQAVIADMQARRRFAQGDAPAYCASQRRVICARRCKSTIGSRAGFSMATTSTKACGRRSSIRTANPFGSQRGSRTYRLRWLKITSRRSVRTSWFCRRGKKCRRHEFDRVYPSVRNLDFVRRV